MSKSKIEFKICTDISETYVVDLDDGGMGSIEFCNGQGSRDFGTAILNAIAYDDRTLPIFDDYVKYTTKIQKPDGYESLSNAQRRREEMKLATNDLKQQIQTGKISKDDFTQQQLAAINAGSDTIPGYTWHHNAQSKPNNFQLLPREIHDAVKHIGEASLSGGK